jgi:7-cyano-7-deazaguanine synthase in queuosine biosynthesis
MSKEAILYSVGLDSYILKNYLSYYKHNFDCLYFDHCGRYTKNEIGYLDNKVEVVNTLNFKHIEKPDAFIPNRNILMSIMANSMGYDIIWIGGSASDRVNDNNEKVFEQLSDFLTKMNGRKIKIDSPFWHVYKENMIEWYDRSIGNTTDLVSRTFSCFKPLSKEREVTAYIRGDFKRHKYLTAECLNCPACFRKCAALWSIQHYIPFYNKSIIQKYKTEFTNCLIKTPRTETTLSYIQKVTDMES